ncbi:MAG: pectate lyase family protein, partial [Planctomycetota bacterium]
MKLLKAFLLLVVFAALAVVVAVMFNCAGSPTPPNPSTPRPVGEQAGLPVFPGAEGFGTRTAAGRGGKVIEVTSLEDGGPGTLRAALLDTGPRIVVFRVGGTITLKSHLFINYPFVTVAGQTAPGDGILLRDFGIVITSHDVLVQHLRIRPGNKGDGRPDHNDAVSLLGRHGDIKDGAHNVVIDHVSTSWGEDETVSTWYGAHNVTISWCVISEALNRSRHHKGTHSAGLLIGDSSEHVSMHHNLLAHNDFRNPLISKGGTHDFVNNMVYNWGAIPGEICDYDSNSFLNFVGNYFTAGPSTNAGPFEILINPTGGSPKIHAKGNIGPHRPTPSADEWSIVGYGWGAEGIAPEKYRALEPYAVAPVTATSAAEAFEKVLAGAGATLPKRDPVDARIVGEVRSKTGRIIDSPDEVGGYPEMAGGTPPADADHDGMPDEWEKAQGLDPNDPS